MLLTSTPSNNLVLVTNVNEVNYYIYCNSSTCFDLDTTDPSSQQLHQQQQHQLYQQQYYASLHSQQQQYYNDMNNTQQARAPVAAAAAAVQASTTRLVLDLEAYLRFRCFMSWLSLLVIVIGLVGNSVSFVILIHPKMRISTNVFLASLCVSGFVALCGLLANSVIYDLFAYYGFFRQLQFITYFYPYVYPLITTFQMYSILLTVCVSLNQFIYIYFSGTKRRTQKKSDKDCRNALKIVLVMFLLSTLFCIPYWLKFRYTRELGLHETELGQNPLFNRIVHFWMYLPIAYFIPLTILIFTNLYLIGTIMLARRRRQRLGMTSSTHSSASMHHHNNNNNHQQQNQALLSGSLKKEDMSPPAVVGRAANIQRGGRQNSCAPASPATTTTTVTRTTSGGVGGMSVTIMLIAVVFLFFACQFPVLVLHIIQSMFCTDSESDRFRCKTSMLYLYAQVIAKFLLICNLSLNFACYCLFSRQFRVVLRETLLISCYRSPNNNNAATAASQINNTRLVNGDVTAPPPASPAI